MQLLSPLDLKHYRKEFTDDKNLQDAWEAAVTNLSKYFNCLAGQRDDEDLRSQTDEENYYDSSLWDQKMLNTSVAIECKLITKDISLKKDIKFG